MQSINITYEDLLNFRSLMKVSVSKEKVKYIWGKRFLKSLTTEERKRLGEKNNEYILEKKEICKKEISKLKIFNWVKFIGISGSVAAGTAKENDDIDIFIVVRNGTMWVYRALITFFNLFHNKIRAKRHRNVKDKLCLNMICEERGLEFESDIFNFHELMFLIPVYNEKYINYIYSENRWLENEYYVKKENFLTRIKGDKDIFFFIKILNQIAFSLQLLFMFVAGHMPDVKLLRNNSKKGKIEFFDKNYKKKKIENYLKTFKSIN